MSFSFRKRASEDEGIPAQDDIEMTPRDPMTEDPEESDDGEGPSRSIFIIAGLAIVLIGGSYLAYQLFLTPPPQPPIPIRPAAPAPPPQAPAPPTPVIPPAPSPTKPPTPEAAKAPPAPPPTGAAPTGPTKPEAGRTLQPEKEPAPSKAEAPTTAKTAPAHPASFSLQVASMVVEANAESLKRKLNEVGFPTVIRKGTAFVTKHVVTVGDPVEKREAEDLARRLNVDGFPSQLLAIGGKYTPQVGAFFSLDEAIDLAREVQKKNYAPKITSKPANTVVFQVRHGSFDSRAAAVKRGEQLKAKGYSFLVVRE